MRDDRSVCQICVAADHRDQAVIAITKLLKIKITLWRGVKRAKALQYVPKLMMS